MTGCVESCRGPTSDTAGIADSCSRYTLFDIHTYMHNHCGHVIPWERGEEEGGREEGGEGGREEGREGGREGERGEGGREREGKEEGGREEGGREGGREREGREGGREGGGGNEGGEIELSMTHYTTQLTHTLTVFSTSMNLSTCSQHFAWDGLPCRKCW